MKIIFQQLNIENEEKIYELIEKYKCLQINHSKLKNNIDELQQMKEVCEKNVSSISECVCSLCIRPFNNPEEIDKALEKHYKSTNQNIDMHYKENLARIQTYEDLKKKYPNVINEINRLQSIIEKQTKDINELKNQKKALEKENEKFISSLNGTEILSKSIDSLKRNLIKPENQKNIEDYQKSDENIHKCEEQSQNIRMDIKRICIKKLRNIIQDFKQTDMYGKKLSEIKLEIREIEDSQLKMKERKKPIEEEINRIEKEQSVKYKDTQKNLKESLIKLVVYQKAVEDLKLYQENLLKNISKYQENQINAINDELEILWMNNKPFGGSIEKIEIETTLKTEHQKTRYEYHINQVKNNSSIDFARTGSSGQKALASLLLRIAVIKLYAKNCPIIALDEPTNSLDNETLNKFIKQLGTIIKDYHLQVILITHNKELVSNIKKIDGIPIIEYKARLDSNSFSVIEKIE